MTDAHCHVSCGNAAVRELLIGRDFVGIHPWDVGADPENDLKTVAENVKANPQLGVGEIGLDRLKDRTVSPKMREVFERQLEIAAQFGRPVVLHGAKCWGQVVKACQPFVGKIPAFLFHGFSRSDGLLPDIRKINGFISIGPAILNDHAVNYRQLALKVPDELILVETDRTIENAAECPPVSAILDKLSELRDQPFDALERLTDANASRFWGVND